VRTVGLASPPRIETEPLGFEHMLHVDSGVARQEFDRGRQLHYPVLVSLDGHCTPFTPTLSRLRGEGVAAKPRRVRGNQASGFYQSTQHPRAGLGDALDRGEPIRQLALGRLNEDMLDPDRGITFEPRPEPP